MKMTSIYDKEPIKFTLFIIDHVTLDIQSQNRRSMIPTAYCLNEGNYKVPEEFSGFYGGKTNIKGLKCTKIGGG